jgi:hypothetical protein
MGFLVHRSLDEQDTTCVTTTTQKDTDHREKQLDSAQKQGWPSWRNALTSVATAHTGDYEGLSFYLGW